MSHRDYITTSRNSTMTPSPPATPPPTNSQQIYPTPQILELLEVFKQCKDGGSTTKSSWQIYTISPDEYKDLLNRAKNDESLFRFINNKLRHDCDSWTHLFTLRMLNPVYEAFLDSVVQEIANQLKGFKEKGEALGEFARKINHIQSSGFEIPSVGSGSEVRHEPDTSFGHEDAFWPGVVIEVSFSPKRRDLPQLAVDYILRTKGSIRLVIGLDLDHRTKKGALLMWRPQRGKNRMGRWELEARETFNQVFRDEKGNPNPSADAGLTLGLADFAPTDLAAGASGLISINALKLCEFLNKAERVQNALSTEAVEDFHPDTVLRSQEKTPPEEDISSL